MLPVLSIYHLHKLLLHYWNRLTAHAAESVHHIPHSLSGWVEYNINRSHLFRFFWYTNGYADSFTYTNSIGAVFCNA